MIGIFIDWCLQPCSFVSSLSIILKLSLLYVDYLSGFVDQFRCFFLRFFLEGRNEVMFKLFGE